MIRTTFAILGAIAILIGLVLYFDFERKNDPEVVGEFWGSVYGTVLLGPTCPVVQDPPDPECADRPYVTRLAVTTADQSRVVKEFSSNTDGAFNIELPPGQYTIRSAATANILPYCASSDTFTVPVNDSVEVKVYCDSGIR